MNLKSSNTLRGKFFDIHLLLESGQSDSNVRVTNSELFRHEIHSDNISEYLDPQKIKNRQQSVSSTLNTGLEFLIFNFSEVVYITKHGEQHVLELNFAKIAKYIDSITKQYQIKNQTIERFEYSFQYFPLINDPNAQDILNKELVNNIVEELGFKNDPATILIMTGEMIWSRYLNSFVIVELLRKLNPVKYAYLDGNGVWDYLLRNEKIGDFINLDKRDLLPQILYLALPEKINKITLDANAESRNVYLINSLNVFNFIPGKYYYDGNMIPEYLIINKNLKHRQEKRFTQIKVGLYQNFNQSITVIPQSHQAEVSKEIQLMMGDSQDCIKEVGDWVNENETIGTYKIFQNEYYFIPKGYSIKVFHGQLLKKGELLAEHTFKGKINAKNAGKVEILSTEGSIIKVQTSIEQNNLISPYSGEVVGKGRKGELRISQVMMTVLKIDAYIGRGICAKLTQEVIKNNIVYCAGYDELIKLIDIDGGIKTHLEIKGIVVNHLSWRDYKKLLTLPHKGLNLAIISLESPSSPFSKELFFENMNSIIYMDKDGIGLKVKKDKTKRNLKTASFNNKIVRFIDFEAHNLYGKIIKSINENNRDYLIDNQDRIIECNLINFMEMADGK